MDVRGVESDETVSDIEDYYIQFEGLSVRKSVCSKICHYKRMQLRATSLVF